MASGGYLEVGDIRERGWQDPKGRSGDWVLREPPFHQLEGLGRERCKLSEWGPGGASTA